MKSAIRICCNGQAICIRTAAHAAGYENRLFDRSRVHTVDIVMNDWDSLFFAHYDNSFARSVTVWCFVEILLCAESAP